MAEALRYNEGKPMMSYFMRSFPKMAEAVARVKEFGANKYNDGNWRLGNKPDKEYWDSLFRHLNYHFQGELYDEDSGCLHIAHAVWNLSALLELNHPDLPAIDEEVFRERMAYWADKKAEREKGRFEPMDMDQAQGCHTRCCCKEEEEEDTPVDLVFIIKDAQKCESFEKVQQKIDQIIVEEQRRQALNEFMAEVEDIVSDHERRRGEKK